MIKVYTINDAPFLFILNVLVNFASSAASCMSGTTIFLNCFLQFLIPHLMYKVIAIHN